jgi:cyclophilin family peptidyl-prolyl cis-trans isomerase
MATAGLDVVDKIATAKTGPNDRPVEPVVIKTIEITEK